MIENKRIYTKSIERRLLYWPNKYQGILWPVYGRGSQIKTTKKTATAVVGIVVHVMEY